MNAPTTPQRAQAGNVAMAMLALMGPLLLVVLIGFALSASHHLDAFTISDHSTEVAVAQDLEEAQRSEQHLLRKNAFYRAICGNAEWKELGSGAIQCIPRRGLKPYAVQLAGVQP